jgi:chromosome partitioning protein
MNNDVSSRANAIAFVHHKGGTGKTTSCLNIAGFLTKMEKRVLVVDLDPQGNATGGLGVDRRSIENSIYDVLFGQMEMEDVILETQSGVHLAPASVDLLAAEMNISELKDHTNLLRESLPSLHEHYDYILIDVPPGSTILMVNGIVAADYLIVPIDAGIFGIETMETLWILLDRLEQELGVTSRIPFALLRAYPAALFGKNPTQELKDKLENFFSTNNFASTTIEVIPYSKVVYSSQIKGIPLSHYRPNSEVGRVFRKISQKILENGNKKFNLINESEPISKETRHG